MRGIATDVNQFTPALVATTKVDAARFVLHKDDPYEAYINNLARLNISSCVVIDADTVAPWGGDWETAIEHYASRVAQKVRLVWAGNEPDGNPPSSWIQSQHDFARLGEIVARRFKAHNNRVLISTGGLSSGNSGWLRSVPLDYYDCISIHPYFKRPDNYNINYGNGTFNDLVKSYSTYKKPIIIGEWGIDDNTIQLDYVRYGLQCWGERDNFLFCLSDRQVDKMGLYDSNLQPKPAYWGFTSMELDIGDGVHALMQRLGDEPRSDEIYYHARRTGEVTHSITEGRLHRYRWTPKDGVQYEFNGEWVNDAVRQVRSSVRARPTA